MAVFRGRIEKNYNGKFETVMNFFYLNSVFCSPKGNLEKFNTAYLKFKPVPSNFFFKFSWSFYDLFFRGLLIWFFEII